MHRHTAVLALGVALVCGPAGVGGAAALPLGSFSQLHPVVQHPEPPGFGVFYVNGVKRTSNWSDIGHLPHHARPSPRLGAAAL